MRYHHHSDKKAFVTISLPPCHIFMRRHKMPIVNPQSLRIRRATTDDLPHLKSVWTSMNLPSEELEKRLTEFQVVEDEAGNVFGAIGFTTSGTNALLHNEGFNDFSVADAARQLFWDRVQVLASNHTVFRLWTQERSPFWKNFGFRPPDAETLARLPAEWRNEYDGAWLTLQLKDEEAIATALGTDFATFMEGEKKQTEHVREQAQKIRNLVTIAGFAIAALAFGFVFYMLVHRGALGH
jgi:N-acetylglutamate synthase-like GNAT family acetyltransferase